MNYLLDTCAISELIKPTPKEHVIQQIRKINNERLFLSVLSIGELDKGIAKLPDSKKKRRLSLWLDHQILTQFEDRLIPFDVDCARRWGRIQGIALETGTVLPVVDAMIAATALVHDLVVITGNSADIIRCGAQVFNPWQAGE